jgi:hypothetical protein
MPKVVPVDVFVYQLWSSCLTAAQSKPRKQTGQQITKRLPDRIEILTVFGVGGQPKTF